LTKSTPDIESAMKNAVTIIFLYLFVAFSHDLHSRISFSTGGDAP
jgi:hypothetical protein